MTRIVCWVLNHDWRHVYRWSFEHTTGVRFWGNQCRRCGKEWPI